MDGWGMANLGDLCDFRRGLTYKKGDEVASSRNAVLRANNVTLATGELNLDDVRYLRDDLVIQESKKVSHGCLLVCTASGSKVHLGKAALIEEDLDFAFGGFMGLLIPSDRIVPKYLFWLTRSDFYTDFIAGLSDGANINNLKWSQLCQFMVPLPSVGEQGLIVSVLDKALAAIATATANAEKNIANARELFESQLEAVIQKASFSGTKVALAELSTDITDGDHQPPPKSPDGIPFITISNIDKVSHTIDFSRTYKVPEAYYSQLKPKRKPRRGDLLYTVTGSFGIPVIVDTEKDFCFQRHIGLIRPADDVSTRWLYYVLLTRDLRMQAELAATGTAQKTVSLRALRAFMVPKLSVSDQERIVASLDELSKSTTALTSLYRQKSAAVAELKQSILLRAFTGELTTDNRTVARELDEAGL